MGAVDATKPQTHLPTIFICFIAFTVYKYELFYFRVCIIAQVA